MHPALIIAIAVIALALFEALAVLFGVDSRRTSADDRVR